MNTETLTSDPPAFRPMDEVDDLPDFPLDRLPPRLAEYVHAVSTACQVPTGLVAVGVLANLAACCQRSALVAVTGDWFEPLSLYAVVALPSGSNKSGAMRRVLEPTRAVEAEMRQDHERDRALEAAGREVAEGQALAARRRLRSGDDPEDKQAALAELADAREILDRPGVAPPTLVASDATPESVVELLANNGERIMIASDEGCEVFDLMTGRYTKSPQYDVFLKAADGSPIDVHRITRSGARLARPALSMLLLVQPVVLRRLRQHKGDLFERGLMGRMLFVTPTSMIGRRTSESAPMPAPLVVEYDQLVRRLLAMPRPQQDAPPVLSLDDDAQRERRAHFERIERRMAPGGDLDWMTSWASKSRGVVARLAGLLHLTSGGTVTRRISAAHVADAVAIVEGYFTPHAEHVWRQAGADPRTEASLRLFDYAARLASEAPDGLSFPRSTLQQRARGRFPRASMLPSPLAMLSEHGYLQLLAPAEGSPRGGRPASPIVQVNPVALAAWERKHRA